MASNPLKTLVKSMRPFELRYYVEQMRIRRALKSTYKQQQQQQQQKPNEPNDNN